MEPAISVLMPVRNGQAFLAEAIGSILAQTFSDFELVIVDDGSTDASAAIAEEFSAGDSRVRLRQLSATEAGRGLSHALNVGLSLTRGAFIARMDADDIAPPDRLVSQLDFMREHGLDVCGGQAECFGMAQRTLWFPVTHEAITRELVFRPAVLPSAMLARAELLRRLRYDETAAFDDYELLTRMVFEARMANMPQTLVRYRQHDGQVTRASGTPLADDAWRFRFRYFFRVFPDATLADFRLVNAVARRVPLESVEALDAAGRWLVRLGDVPEHACQVRMAERWARACDDAAVPAAQADPIRRRHAVKLAG